MNQMKTTQIHLTDSKQKQNSWWQQQNIEVTPTENAQKGPHAHTHAHRSRLEHTRNSIK